MSFQNVDLQNDEKKKFAQIAFVRAALIRTWPNFYIVLISVNNTAIQQQRNTQPTAEKIQNIRSYLNTHTKK